MTADLHPSAPLRTIWFDCDSTLSAIEGIDELAARRTPDVRDEIRALTARAMDGGATLEEVYATRLNRIAPTWAECKAVGVQYVDRLVPDAVEVAAALRFLGKTLGMISGGLIPCVEPLARHLGLHGTHLLAVPVQFDPDGGYAGFDESNLLTRTRGKPTLLSRRPDDERPMALVGDGSTDLAAQDVVDRFVGFGGVVARPAVRAGARCFAEGPGLRTALPFLLTEAELERLRCEPSFAPLVS
ncbi:MAG: HAD-IB family phosphatase [Planctomycetes bacterium]|nr:HAD-IB family phosphatase [Planctomycetota bacterium]